MHAQDIIYRDLKPENIMLQMKCKGHLKLVDFGFSKMMKVPKTHTKCGTIVYIAPEILVGSGHDHKVDIWSLGVLLFAMLCGTVPFKAGNLEDLHKLILKGEFQFPCELSAEA